MIIFSVSLAIIFLVIFIISARSGQFEDDESPAVRILLDDKPPVKEDDKTENKDKK